MKQSEEERVLADEAVGDEGGRHARREDGGRQGGTEAGAATTHKHPLYLGRDRRQRPLTQPTAEAARGRHSEYAAGGANQSTSPGAAFITHQ